MHQAHSNNGTLKRTKAIVNAVSATCASLVVTCRSDLREKDPYTVQSIKVEMRHLSDIYNMRSQAGGDF